MRYILRLIRLLILWPLLIIFYILAMVSFNLLSIIWYFNTEHLEGFDNFWYPIVTDGYDTTSGNYNEFYKTPKDLLLDKRFRVYGGEKNEIESE